MEQVLPFLMENWLLIIMFLIVLVLIIRNEANPVVAGIRLLSPQETVAKINHENAVIFDIRSKELFTKTHIANAVHFPSSSTSFKKIQKYKKQPIILVCDLGQQAPKFGAKMKKEGFEQIFSLKGGLRAWKQDELPLKIKK